MPTLTIEVTHKAAPITTQMKQYDKGVEHFYYAGLFTQPPYTTKEQVWRSWLRMGFHIGIRETPRAAAKTDRLVIDVFADGKLMRVSASSQNREALKRLQAFLQHIDGLRVSQQGKTIEARAKAVEADNKVREQLVAPVVDSLKKANFSGEEVDSFLRMIHRALTALTDEEITTVRYSLN